MARLIVASLLLALAALAVEPQRALAGQATPTGEMVAINDVLMQLMDGYSRGDLDAVGKLMANEVVAFGSIFDARGLAEVKQKAGPALNGIKGARPLEKPDVTMSGNLAFAAFRTDVEKDATVGASSVRLRWTIVLQKASNRWVVTHFHVSPDPETR
jgi:ketosteroid isomerase-like protein